MSLYTIIETLLIGPLKLIFEIIYVVALRFIGHPGLAIIVLSLVMNILVLPLYKRADAMQEEARDTEAKLRDGIAHIKKTFSGDERMMILQTYYRQNHYSPLSALNGSVSLLLEIPFFMAAYQFLSGLEILDGEHLNVLVVPMPEGLDPDDVAKQGKDAYQRCLDAAMPLIDYKLHAIERKYNLERTEEKRAFVKEALKVVATTESSAVREDLLKKLRDKTGLTYLSLERDLEGILKDGNLEEEEPTVGTDMQIKEVASGSDKLGKAERFILAAKLFNVPYAREHSLAGVHFVNPVHARIAEFICEYEQNGERIRPSELFTIFDESCPELNEILDLSYEDKLEGKVAEKFFQDSFAVLEREGIEREIALLKEELKKTDEQEKKKIILGCLQDALLRQRRR